MNNPPTGVAASPALRVGWNRSPHRMGAGNRNRSVDRAARDDQAVLLTGDRGDVLEVGVVAEHGRPVLLGYHGGKQIHGPGCAVQAVFGHQSLRSPSPLFGIGGDRQIDPPRTVDPASSLCGGV